MLTLVLWLVLWFLLRSISDSLDPSLVRAKLVLATMLALWLIARMAG